MIERHELDELLEFAVDAARDAGRIAMEWFGREIEVERKADATPVTVADRRGEELLRERLADRCPDDGVIGEEFGVVEGETGRRWTLDPIDGTISFVHGVPLFCTLIGLLDGDRSVLGVIHLPAIDETIAAASGRGCRWTFRGETRTARVSTREDLSASTALMTDLGRLPGPDLGAAFARFRGSVRIARTWGDGYGHALVATGRAEAMIDPTMAPWDSVPLQPIVEEAGGRFSTLSGEPRPDGGSAISTNGVVHDRVLELLEAG